MTYIRGKKWTTEDRREVALRYANGDTFKDIGAYYDLTRERIRQIVLKACRDGRIQLYTMGHSCDFYDHKDNSRTEARKIFSCLALMENLDEC